MVSLSDMFPLMMLMFFIDLNNQLQKRIGIMFEMLLQESDQSLLRVFEDIGITPDKFHKPCISYR